MPLAALVPTSLEQWTLYKIREVAASGVAENEHFDFKTDLQPADKQRKIVAALANTKGGFLIFGVTDHREVIGVENRELPRDFGSKVDTGIDPPITYEFGLPLEVQPGRVVFVCHVHPRSGGLHAVQSDGAVTFLKRTASGSNVTMSRAEILSEGSKSSKPQGALTLLQNEIEHLHERALETNGVIWGRPLPAERLMRIADARSAVSQIESLLPHVCHELAEDVVLRGGLNALRESLARFDLLNQRLRNEGCTPDALLRYQSTLREVMPNVVGDARRVLDRFRQSVGVIR